MLCLQGEFRQATMDDLELVLKWSRAFNIDCFGDSKVHIENKEMVIKMLEGGTIYFWKNPEPVSMAALTRPTKNGISISFVYTPPKCRKHGYASAVTARLSQAGFGVGAEILHAFYRFKQSHLPTASTRKSAINRLPILQR